MYTARPTWEGPRRRYGEWECLHCGAINTREDAECRNCEPSVDNTPDEGIVDASSEE